MRSRAGGQAIWGSRLGEEAWEEALAEGRAMTLERAVAYALGEGATLA